MKNCLEVGFYVLKLDHLWSRGSEASYWSLYELKWFQVLFLCVLQFGGQRTASSTHSNIRLRTRPRDSFLKNRYILIFFFLTHKQNKKIQIDPVYKENINVQGVLLTQYIENNKKNNQY